MSMNRIVKLGLSALAGATALAALAVPALAQHHGLRWPDNVHVQIQVGHPPPVVVVAAPPVYAPPPAYAPPPVYQPQYAPAWHQPQPQVVAHQAPIVVPRLAFAPRPGYAWVDGRWEVASCGMRSWAPGHWVRAAPVYPSPQWDGHHGHGKHKYGHGQQKSRWQEARGHGHHGRWGQAM